MFKVPVEISARHLHISREDLDELFGKNYSLRKKKDLTQPGEFSAEERVAVQNGKNKIDNVRIIGPLRKKTQLELSATDAFNLGLEAPYCYSGNAKGLGIVIIGKKGRLKMNSGVMVPLRHLHISGENAKKMHLKNGKKVSIRVQGERSVVFENVLVRVGKNYVTSFHLDTDEGNAAGIEFKGEGYLI
ncbi:MAG: phosphate propanoyltransferase [Candidatus Paceibacterota bacterium]|jgi:propanediol utilization protein